MPILYPTVLIRITISYWVELDSQFSLYWLKPFQKKCLTPSLRNPFPSLLLRPECPKQQLVKGWVSGFSKANLFDRIQVFYLDLPISDKCCGSFVVWRLYFSILPQTTQLTIVLYSPFTLYQMLTTGRLPTNFIHLTSHPSRLSMQETPQIQPDWAQLNLQHFLLTSNSPLL